MSLLAIPGTPLTDPPLGFRFNVTFLKMGVLPLVADFRFQSVSGIGVSLKEQDIETSQHSNRQTVTYENVKYTNLTLKRGVMLGSPLSKNIERSFREMKFETINILVSALNEVLVPVKVWKFSNAYPVKWTISGLDATQNGVLFEEIEMAYSHFENMAL